MVNKIAAGEVIERPASVVKELMENALDSQATRIDVSIEDGGKRLIQVSDNGCGMDQADAALAFWPHATSKISGEDDLFNIGTMGFRGEALASIASISHAHIRTRRLEDEGGWEVSASGATVDPPTPCPAAAGTTVSIRDLFYNTPARRKFLKTTNTEFGHITEQVTRLALPQPEVAFTLRHNGREVLNLPATNSTVGRVASLFTPDLAGCLLPITQRTGQVRIAGLIAPPSAARSAAKWQYVFVNGRYIRDRLVSHALREAFRGLLAPTKFPVVFLFIEIDPADVDVNVHPTKIEVRFRDGNQVYGEVLAALRETLNRADLRSQATTSLDEDMQSAGKASPAQDKKESLRQALADFLKKAPSPQPRLDFPTGNSAPSQAQPLSQPFQTPPRQHGRAETFDNTGWAKPTTAVEKIPPTPAGPDKADDSVQPTSNNYELSPPPLSQPNRPLMQVHNSYIVAETDDGLTIIDQHALHERILYNDFQRRLLAGELQSQQMLIPLSISVSQAEAVLLENSTELLAKLGIEISSFGPGAYAVHRYPTVLAERGVAMDSFLRELLDKSAEDEMTDPERMLEDVLAMMACKAAVKAGNPLTTEEMQSILDASAGLDKASSCPHGRPTTLRLTLKDLEKQFKRS